LLLPNSALVSTNQTRARRGGMNTSIKWMTLSGVVLAAGLYAGVACAQDPAAVLETRSATMKAQGKDMGAIKAYIDDKSDLAAAQAAGADLVTQVAKIPTLFPKGTGMAEFPDKSYARPVIWTDWDKFLAGAKTAAAKADALNAALKGGDKAAITAAFGDMGKNGCGACHEPFREPKKS
jgi:cytochrome c556